MDRRYTSDPKLDSEPLHALDLNLLVSLDVLLAEAHVTRAAARLSCPSRRCRPNSSNCARCSATRCCFLGRARDGADGPCRNAARPLREMLGGRAAPCGGAAALRPDDRDATVPHRDHRLDPGWSVLPLVARLAVLAPHARWRCSRRNRARPSEQLAGGELDLLLAHAGRHPAFPENTRAVRRDLFCACCAGTIPRPRARWTWTRSARSAHAHGVAGGRRLFAARSTRRSNHWGAAARWRCRSTASCWCPAGRGVGPDCTVPGAPGAALGGRSRRDRAAVRAARRLSVAMGWHAAGPQRPGPAVAARDAAPNACRGTGGLIPLRGPKKKRPPKWAFELVARARFELATFGL